MKYVLQIVSILIDALFVHQLFSCILVKKEKTKILVCCFVIFFIVAVALSNVEIHGELRLLFNTLTIFVLSFFCFRGTVLTHFMAAAFFYCVYLVGDFFGYGIMYLFDDGLKWTGMIGLYVYLLIFGLLFSRLYFAPRDPVDQTARLAVLGGSLACSIVMASLIYCFRFTAAQARQAGLPQEILEMMEIPPVIYIACGLFFVTFNFVIILMCKSQAEKREAQGTRIVYQSQIAQYESYYETMEKMFCDTRQLQHDLRHHTEAIYSMVAEQQYDEALKYVSGIQAIQETPKLYGRSGNLAVDVMLQSCMAKAEKASIQINLTVNYKQLDIESVDLCVLLGNALENALDACKKLSHPEESCIRVIIEQQDPYLYLKVINPVEWDVKTKGRLPMTTKENAEYHGYGLRSIQNVVEKYEGHISCKVEGGSFVLSCMLLNQDPDAPLPIQQNNAESTSN